MGLRELQHCTKQAVNWIKLAVSAPWVSTSGRVQFPHWGSSRLEDGLSNLSWETRGYELCPLGSHTHSFHNSERGWKIIPAASERRSLLTGIPHGEPSRREIGSENYTWPGQNGILAIEGPHPDALSLELPGAERSGERRTDEAGCLPRQDVCSYIATKGRIRYLYALPPKHISGTSCDGEGVCIF